MRQAAKQPLRRSTRLSTSGSGDRLARNSVRKQLAADRSLQPIGGGANLKVLRRISEKERAFRQGGWMAVMSEGLRRGQNYADEAAKNLVLQTRGAAAQLESEAAPSIEAYRESRAHDLAAMEVVSSLVRIFPFTFAAHVTSKIASEIGKEFAGAALSEIEGLLTGAIENADRLGSSPEALTAALDLIPNALEVKESMLPVSIKRRYSDPADRIREKLRNKQGGLLTREETLLGREFMYAQQADTNEAFTIAVEKTLGLPRPEKLIDYQVDLFRSWFTQFSRMMIKARATSSQAQLDYVASHIPGAERYTFEGQARDAGRRAAKRHRKRLTGYAQ